MSKLLKLTVLFLSAIAVSYGYFLKKDNKVTIEQKQQPLELKYPTNMDYCYCTYTALHYSGSEENRHQLEKEIKEKYNQTYEERVIERCEIFSKNQDFSQTAFGINTIVNGKVTECLEKRKKKSAIH